MIVAFITISIHLISIVSNHINKLLPVYQSMGQSLTFERSVMEAIDYHRTHKCKDPLCETQLWKAKHELDLALLKISQLRKQIA